MNQYSEAIIKCKLNRDSWLCKMENRDRLDLMRRFTDREYIRNVVLGSSAITNSSINELGITDIITYDMINNDTPATRKNRPNINYSGVHLQVMLHPSGYSNSSIVTPLLPYIINLLELYGYSEKVMIYSLVKLYTGYNKTKMRNNIEDISFVIKIIKNRLAPWTLATKLCNSGFVPYMYSDGAWIEPDIITKIIKVVDSLTHYEYFIDSCEDEIKSKVIEDSVDSDKFKLLDKIKRHTPESMDVKYFFDQLFREINSIDNYEEYVAKYLEIVEEGKLLDSEVKISEGVTLKTLNSFGK